MGGGRWAVGSGRWAVGSGGGNWGGVMRELAKGPGHIGQILLAELLDAPLSFTGKPVHHPLTVKICMHMACSV